MDGRKSGGRGRSDGDRSSDEGYAGRASTLCWWGDAIETGTEPRSLPSSFCNDVLSLSSQLDFIPSKD